MARIFMTGGTGFISANVARRLAEGDHEVHVFHRGETSADLPESIRHHYGDRTFPGELSAAMDIVAPDIFIDMNPFTHEEAARAASAATQADVRATVVISSGDVYRQCDGLRGRWDGEPDPIPLAEDAPLRQTRYPYRDKAESREGRLHDYDKLEVEQAYREAELPATILRLPKVFGRGDLTCFNDYIQRLERFLPVIEMSTARAGWRWSRADVDSVAEAIAEVGSDPHEGVFNLAPEQCPTELDWLHMLADALGWGGAVREPKQEAPSQDEYDWRFDVVLDGSRFREIWSSRLLAYPQAAIDRALGDMVDRERPVPPPAKTTGPRPRQ